MNPCLILFLSIALRLPKQTICLQHSIFLSVCISCLTAFHLSLHSFSAAMMHCFPPQGVCGYACLHLCVFVSVITIASCAADKSLAQIKDNSSGDLSSPANGTHIDRHDSLMQIALINICLKAIPYSHLMGAVAPVVT